jgi:hypothetical protein
MYNTNYECRYYKDDIILKIENCAHDEKEYIKDVLYKEDLINIFNLKESDNLDGLDNILSIIYEKIKNNNELKECMVLSASKLLSEDEQFGLCILYSYDFMYLTHDCVSDYLKFNFIMEDKITKLKQCLND